LIGLICLSGCRSEAQRSEPSSTTDVTLADAQAICDGVLSGQAAAALHVISGTRRWNLGATSPQATVEGLANGLGADLWSNSSIATHTLCAAERLGKPGMLQISFEVRGYHALSEPPKSWPDMTAYDIAWGASSTDSEATIDYSCLTRSGKTTHGRGLYIFAKVATPGLDAAGDRAKREAQVRVVFAAARRVADAMKCETNLPRQLGELKALPMAGATTDGNTERE
jgi:hypothetical protein